MLDTNTVAFFSSSQEKCFTFLKQFESYLKIEFMHNLMTFLCAHKGMTSS